MRFVAAVAALNFDRHVFKRKRPTFIAVTIQTRDGIGMTRHHLDFERRRSAMRRMTAHAIHRSTRQLMAERTVEMRAF
jgi:hypothetical protein